MEIRLATPSDLDAINSFDIFAGDRGLDVQRGECFVALDGGRVAGYVVFNRSFYLKPFVQFLCVSPEFRRRGCATKLLGHVEGMCAGEKLFTSTESDNLAMLRLLPRMGYRVAGLVEHIQEQAEIIFCKSVGAASVTAPGPD